LIDESLLSVADESSLARPVLPLAALPMSRFHLFKFAIAIPDGRARWYQSASTGVHLGNLNRVAELIQSFKRVTAETVLISAFSTSEACRPA
jgi:hypothetical protein